MKEEDRQKLALYFARIFPRLGIGKKKTMAGMARETGLKYHVLVRYFKYYEKFGNLDFEDGKKIRPLSVTQCFVVKYHGKLPNSKIAQMANTTEHCIRQLVYILRKRGILPPKNSFKEAVRRKSGKKP
jgi:hypothetical protein